MLTDIIQLFLLTHNATKQSHTWGLAPRSVVIDHALLGSFWGG